MSYLCFVEYLPLHNMISEDVDLSLITMSRDIEEREVYTCHSSPFSHPTEYDEGEYAFRLPVPTETSKHRCCTLIQGYIYVTIASSYQMLDFISIERNCVNGPFMWHMVKT